MAERTVLLVAGGAGVACRRVRCAPLRAGSACFRRAEDDMQARLIESCGSSCCLCQVRQARVVAHHSGCLYGDCRKFTDRKRRQTPVRPCDARQFFALSRTRREDGPTVQLVSETSVVWPPNSGLASTQRQQEDRLGR